MSAFDNLPEIDGALRHMYGRLGAGLVNSFSSDLQLQAFSSALQSDPVIATQTLAKAIAAHFRLRVGTIAVTFEPGLPAPGRIELSRSRDFFIEIAEMHRTKPRAISAILAHEISHLFLFEHKVEMEPRPLNEILTDTAAVFLGCGVAILNGAEELERWLGHNQLERQLRHFGYLTLPEFGYIQAKRDVFHGRDSTAAFESGPPLRGYVAGKLILQRERGGSPVSRPSVLSRVGRAIRAMGTSPGTGDNPIVFRCLNCSQPLRVSGGRGEEVTIRCPLCQRVERCYF